jgi:CheY-like chemotaxis protein
MESGEAVAPEPTSFMPEGNERILLVDDEPDIVAAARIILERLGYQVVGRTDGPEALAAFQAEPQSFDLIFTGLTMPKLTGLDLARESLALRPDIPIIGCTGYDEAITLEKARTMGIKEILRKPLMPAQLAQTIRRLLDSPKAEAG